MQTLHCSSLFNLDKGQSTKPYGPYLSQFVNRVIEVHGNCQNRMFVAFGQVELNDGKLYPSTMR